MKFLDESSIFSLKTILTYQGTDQYKKLLKIYYEDTMNRFLENISYGIVYFVFSIILTSLFAKLEQRFFETISFSVMIFSFCYILYSIYRCIRLFCRRSEFFS
jgi:hypothetical protein